MTQITLHNTRTRRKEAFAPIDPENVRMYVCGPTVYDRAHLGNARPVVVFDVLYRLLRHVYGPDHVTYVRNFTDVDDKINARARDMQAKGDTRDLNAIIRTLTDETIDWYHADMDALGTLRPNHEPRATAYIAQMVSMIEGLVARGHAYPAEGHVLFDVRSYPDYGRLSGRSVDDMIAGARVEVAPYKRDPMDFVLWKPSAADEPGWDSPWGRGRPGWHIECSAMADELLGASFDIHGGGIDLQFPHHENEIAQSCCAHPDAAFANFWLHNEMVQVEGKKMSKSLGNFFTVRDLLEGKTELGSLTGLEIRMAFLMSHYRTPIDLNHNRIVNARSAIREICENISKLGSVSLQSFPHAEPIGIVDICLKNDLDTAAAIAEIRARLLNKQKVPLTEGFIAAAVEALNLLGLDVLTQAATVDYARLYDQDRIEHSCKSLALLEEKLAALRVSAKAKRDFSEVDSMVAALQNAGVEVRMTQSGVFLIRQPDFDPSKLEGLE